MPSYRYLSHARGRLSIAARPWHARQKRDGIEYSLGRYRTRAEAISAEDQFSKIYPKTTNHSGIHQRVSE